VNTYRAEHLYGDATVPIVGASRPDVKMDSPLLRRIADKHGNLQRNKAASDELEGILTASPVTVRAQDTIDLHVDTPELILAGENLQIQVTPADGGRHPIRITITDEAGTMVDSRLPKPAGSTTVTTISDLPPGAYTIDVTGLQPSTPISPVSSDILIWE
jgi:hypothetical protein